MVLYGIDRRTVVREIKTRARMIVHDIKCAICDFVYECVRLISEPFLILALVVLVCGVYLGDAYTSDW